MPLTILLALLSHHQPNPQPLSLTPLVELAGLGGQERLEGYELFSLIRHE